MLAICLGPAGAAGQVVGGTIRERESGTPLRAALVVLLDSTGTDRGATLSDEQGTFVLRAPAPGRYRVRAEHIGHETVASAALQVGAGATVRIALQADISPVLLQPLQVAGQSRCRVRPAAAEATSRLWEEARKALRLSRMSRQVGHVTVQNYTRTVDATSGLVLAADTVLKSGMAARPYISQREDSLHELGYLRTQRGGGFQYFGPDEDVLLSDGFLEHHCIGLREGGEETPGLVGLAFRGVGGTSEIDGVLWLDRSSAELRSLDFSYRVPWDVDEAAHGGHIDFTRLPSGAIAVASWYLRMPTKLLQHRNGPALTVTEYVETGGRVLGLGARGTAKAAPPP